MAPPGYEGGVDAVGLVLKGTSGLRLSADVMTGSCSRMAVTRIVANLAAPDPMALAKFYQEVFDLDLPFDMGWIVFLSSDTTQKIELHTASEGGSGTELPVISIGVDDLEATETAVRAAGAEIVYGPVKESWGLRRFFFRDPAGNLVNVVDN
ncbi:VOC family protein [Nitrobacter sp.]|uniref:VOC family protein n=1 Tax=Nitrobacter sp. TaxID=29420 RepID=UPI003F649D6D